MLTFLKQLFASPRETPRPAVDDLRGLVPPGLIEFPLPGMIQDGVDYYLPQPLPAHIRNDPDRLSKFTEALEQFRTQFATPYQTGGPFSEPNSFLVDPLAEWDWDTRRYVLEQCHLAWERNPLANAAVAYNRLFSIGSGFTETFRNEAVRDILTAFIEDPQNNIRELDMQLCEALQVDGEIFVRKAFAPGRQLIAPLRAWGIQWIRADPDNVNIREDYRYNITLDDGSGLGVVTHTEDIPAAEICHVAINRLPYEQRGRPDLFRILTWLRGYKEWLETRARVNYYRSLIMWDVTFTNSTPSQIAGRMASIKKPPSPGSINAHSDRETWNMVNPTVGAADAAEDGRQIKLMAAAGMRIPEFALSDGANANLASATAQSLPALRSFAEYQRVMRNFWVGLFKEVIAYNVAVGNLPPEVQDQHEDGTPVEGADPILAIDAFDIVYPSLESSDPLNAVQAVLLALNSGLISKETATGLLPYDVDPYDEKQKMDAESEQNLKDIAAGRAMPPMPAESPFGTGGGLFGPPPERNTDETGQ